MPRIGGILLMLCAMLLGWVLPHSVLAFSFSPERVFIDIAPGAERLEQLQIVNDVDVDVFVDVKVRSFVASDTVGAPMFTDAEIPTGIAPFVVASSQRFVMKAGERKTYPFTVRIPVGTEPGSYYGALHFAFAPVDGANGAVAMTGPLMFLTVTGAAQSELSLVLSNELPAFQGMLPKSFAVTLVNNGTMVEVPSGEVRVINALGDVTRSYRFNAERGAMLPGDVREFLIGESPVAGEGIQAEFTGLGLGPYRVELEVVPKDGVGIRMPLGAVWVFPWRLTMLGLGIALILGVALTMLFPRFGRTAV